MMRRRGRVLLSAWRQVLLMALVLVAALLLVFALTV